jgi:hypothetical protein
MATNVRNILIVLIIAALVVVIPGGGTGANVLIQAVSLAFLASIAWVARLMYREHRFSLYALGDDRRLILYAAVGVGTLTLTATTRMWSTIGGRVVWVLLVAAAIYGVVSVVVAARRY